MPERDEITMRLIRADDIPATSPRNDDYIFGLQDTRQEIVPGTRDANGALVFDFSLRVKPGTDPDRPVFTGRFASGPPQDRFVYLSWRSMPRGVWINRVKARLSPITWTVVRAAWDAGQPVVADMSGRGPGHSRQPVVWQIGSG